jgi:hypothetical protein
MPSGFSAAFEDALACDVAVIYYDVAATATKIGVTRDGIDFKPNIQWRQPVFDGARSKIELLDRKTFTDATLSFKLLEMNSTVLTHAEAGSALSTSTTTVTLTPRVASTMLTAGQYITNLDAVWLRGDAKTVRLRFARALCVDYSISSRDNNETEISFTFETRLTNSVAASSTDTIPWTYEVIG